ncbi:MAG: hypothetical protein PHN75_19320 [Syntrophales bacterium]|nr:hypothetical protein [Syntrophales bacterium]
MKTEEILHLSDLNLAEYTREMTRWNGAGEIFKKDDLLRYPWYMEKREERP